MLNWTAFSFANYIVMSPDFKKPNSTASIEIAETARISTTFPDRYGNVPVHWGMILAAVAVFAIWIILNKTTLGYRLRMVGFNRDAAEYAGVSVPVSIATSMSISGLLAGLGGATQLCGVLNNLTQLANQEGYGFDGISVSMIGGINPIGALFSGVFFGGMKYGGSKLNLIQAPTELVNVIIGAIIYTIAIMGAFRLIVKFMKAKKEGRPL
jgi:simple sugar transport system permease protein